MTRLCNSSLLRRPIARIATVAVALATGFASPAAAQDVIPKNMVPAGPLVIRNAWIHPVSSEPILSGTLIAEDGVITWVGPTDAAPEAPADAEVIDAGGRALYPGLIGGNTVMGLMEIGSVAASMDDNEIGAITPEARAIAAVNPDSTIIPVTRTAGVLTVATMPTGGLVTGRAAIIRLDGWTWEDMAVVPEAGLCVNWPSLRPVTAWWMTDSPEQQIAAATEELRNIGELFDQAEAYAAARAADASIAPDVRLEAMLPAIEGRELVFIRANELDQIRSAATFCGGRGLRGVIVGGVDAEDAAESLIAHDVAVMITGTHRLPRARHDAYDEPFTLPARLEAAGVRWCLASSGGSFETPHERNLPFHAATAVAHGLDEALALRSITLSAAEVLGIGDRLGSLEPGKAATFFLADGDILEIVTRVDQAWIDGRACEMDDKHQQLDRKYREKYRQIDGDG